MQAKLPTASTTWCIRRSRRTHPALFSDTPMECNQGAVEMKCGRFGRIIISAALTGTLLISSLIQIQNLNMNSINLTESNLPFSKPSSPRSYPGRFEMDNYPNTSIVVGFRANPAASPYISSECAPGLTCSFTDKSWHEIGWDHNIVTFPKSPKKPNTVYISLESPSRCGMNVLGHKQQHAGLAVTDLRSDIPVTYLPSGSIDSIHKPKSSEISVWRVLHIASNCDYTFSSRNRWVEALVKRGLVDSYGKCHHNKEWSSINITQRGHIHSGENRNNKRLLMRKYAFVTAFEVRMSSG